ncbi:MAG: hypothetical protein JNJ45_08970 [Chthonomonas sp.]|nr:hypothetical protein [Chthonomonas sp.]
MKLGVVVLGLAALAAALGWRPAAPAATVIWIGGNTSGYLEPCGCVKPMTGGIRRKATLLRQQRGADDLTVELGPFIKDPLRQSQLKLDAMAEFGRAAQVDAMGLMAGDMKLDGPVLAAANSLSGGRFVQSQSTAVTQIQEAKGWTIGAISPRLGDPGTAWTQLSSAAGENPILVMFDGDLEAASAFAANRTGLKVVCYPSSSPEAKNVGGVMVVGTGERGKYVGRLDLTAKRYKSFALGPEFADDSAVSRVMARYLARVKGENLIAQEPRSHAAAFAGSKACAPCHTKIVDQWTKTGHGKAFVTLQKEQHDFDPDCVKCHVVGKDKTTGFVSVAKTPQLQHVGCESCHGPARDHAKKPKVYKLAKAGPQSCQTCHVPDHSPAFNFDSYWQKIKHGRPK